MEQMRIKVSTAMLTQRADTAEEKIQIVKERFQKIEEIVRNSCSYWEGSANEAH